MKIMIIQLVFLFANNLEVYNITGKFNIINNDSLFKFPSFKSKFGFNIDLNETVI